MYESLKAKLVLELTQVANLKETIKNNGPAIIAILTNENERKDFFARFSGTGVSIAQVRREIAVCAAENGQLDVLDVAIDAKDTNATYDILIRIAENKNAHAHTKVMKYCLENLKSFNLSQTSLSFIAMIAGSTGNLDVINLCIANGLEPKWYTAFFIACINALKLNDSNELVLIDEAAKYKKILDAFPDHLSTIIRCMVGDDIVKFKNNDVARLKCIKHFLDSETDKSKLSNVIKHVISPGYTCSEDVIFDIFRYCIEQKNVNITQFYGDPILSGKIKKYVDSHQTIRDLKRALACGAAAFIISGITTAALYSTAAFVPIAAATAVIVGVEAVVGAFCMKKTKARQEDYPATPQVN